MKKSKRTERILQDMKAGERKPPMPSPKRFTDRKKQARKTACQERQPAVKGYNMERMQYRGFIIKKMADGKFSASYKSSLGKTYSIERVSYCECGEWVWNIADNHDIGTEANHRMCRKWGRSFFESMQGEGSLSL